VYTFLILIALFKAISKFILCVARKFKLCILRNDIYQIRVFITSKSHYFRLVDCLLISFELDAMLVFSAEPEIVLLQSNNEEEEMSDTELMPEDEEEISGEEGTPRGINGLQSQNSPPPPAELLAKLKQQVSLC